MSRISILLICTLMFLRCSKTPDAPDSISLENKSPLQIGLEKWRAQGLSDYRFKFVPTCECPDAYSAGAMVMVRHGKIDSIYRYYDSTGLKADSLFTGYWTIDALFARLDSALQSKPAYYHFLFHPDYGYPMVAYVDFSAQLADEELIFRIDTVLSR